MSDVLEVFKDACRIAGQISLPRQQQGKIEIAVDKGGGDIATHSDFDAGTAMTAIIKEALPGLPIVPEENKTGQSDQDFRAERQAILSTGTFILMDDLDATVRYRWGGEDWGHMLGLVQNGILTHCAMYMPARDVMVLAQLGQGCFVNGERQHLDPTQTPDGCLMYLAAHKDLHPSFQTDVVNGILYSAQPSGYVCLNSNIGGVTRLVQGELGGFLGCGHNWDFVGALAVIEAGGAALSATGKTLNWQQIPMVMVAAANQQIANAMLAVSRKYNGYGKHFWRNPKFTK